MVKTVNELGLFKKLFSIKKCFLAVSAYYL